MVVSSIYVCNGLHPHQNIAYLLFNWIIGKSSTYIATRFLWFPVSIRIIFFKPQQGLAPTYTSVIWFTVCHAPASFQISSLFQNTCFASFHVSVPFHVSLPFLLLSFFPCSCSWFQHLVSNAITPCAGIQTRKQIGCPRYPNLRARIDYSLGHRKRHGLHCMFHYLQGRISSLIWKRR